MDEATPQPSQQVPYSWGLCPSLGSHRSLEGTVAASQG